MKRLRSTIPYGRQYINNNDISAVAKAMKSHFLTQGPMIEAFERGLCEYTGAKYCVAVSSGTAALHLAVASLDLAQGCSGVTSPITFLASANAMVYNGVRPLFADIDPVTANIAVEAIAGAITRDTRVIIPVHFAGRAASMRKISAIARRKNCFVIEDAAHAIGSRYPYGGRVGNCAYSDMTIFSFHPVKTITTGEGGAIMTNDKKFYERLRCLRSHGVTRDPSLMKKSPGPWYYEMQSLGFNYRLTDIQAALGLSQLKRIEHFVSKRSQIVARYNAAFSRTDWLKPVSSDDTSCAYHLYVVRIDFPGLGISRAAFMKELAERGVGTQVHYIPVHLQPYFRKKYGYKKGDYPEAEKYYEQCLSLPLFPSMTTKDVRTVAEAVQATGGRR